MDHRSYQSILPTPNKLLQKRWDQQRYNTHKSKVRSSSCIVDTRAPKAHMHVQMKLKKQQIEEERLAVIERDNRMLLEKMSIIMRSKGRVDSRNLYEHKSLNKEKRERELLRVAEENKGILRRLQAVKPLYNRHLWESDFSGHETFMENISRYPLGNQTWPAYKRKHRATKSTGGIALPPLPSKKEPATKVEEVKDNPDTNGNQQGHNPPAKETEEKPEEAKTTKQVTEVSSTGSRDADLQKEEDKESATAEQNDQTKADIDQLLSEGDKQENDDSKGHEDKEDNKCGNEQNDKQNNQHSDQHLSQQLDQSNDDHKGKLAETQEDKQVDKREQKQQNEQDVSQDVKEDAKQEEKQENLSDNVVQKTGVELDVEVTHQLLEEKKSDVLIELLLQHDEAYRYDLKEKYKEQYDKDLMEEIQSAFTNPLANAFCAAFRTLAEFDAWCLHETISGTGMTEAFLFEVLGARNNENIKAIRGAYKKMYHKQLEEDVGCDASGDFEKLFRDLLNGNRVEDMSVDEELAIAEANELHEAGEDDWESDQSVLTRILANRSRDQLVATFQEYDKVAGSTILEAATTETSGDRLLGLRTLVLLALDPWKLSADRVHECLEEPGKEGEVTRVAFGTVPNDRPSLKERYQEIYSQSLVEAANEKLSGDYAKLITGVWSD